MSSEAPRHAEAPTRAGLAIDRMDELVGNTPLVRLRRMGDPDGAPLYVKLEDTNPAGSMRDRYVAEIIERAMLAGQLVEGDTVALAGIDDSAVAAACLGAVLGLDARIFAPESSSKRLVPLIERYGGTVEWTDDEGGLDGAIESAAHWARGEVDRLYVDGHRRSAVRDAYASVAHEILDALGSVPLGGFITSVTTGGTFREVSKVLLEHHPMLKFAGAQIVENEFATGEAIESVVPIPLADAWEIRDEIARKEGLLLSPKGAACVRLAIEMQANVLNDQAIIALNPDAGQRYLGWEEKAVFKTDFTGEI